ncbi:FkbM family methyltransferase [Rhodopirellula sp. MGV]|uniref:FkbM family methyltransferase n=1 Tax=Rhodopirellula sp. MGV TaxID=2023130 RepID=UPI001303FC04|nr:FkbM family methyltransferase [Rhodopirellula sp. MGV]
MFSSVGLEHLDLQLVSLLKGKRGGVFIEAGANNGVCQSNTYYFERVLGWTGILVEPTPELYEQCRKLRKGSKVFNAALVREGYPNPTVQLEQAGLMSVVNDGAINAEVIDAHIRNGLEIQRLNAKAAIEVTARTLQSILDECSVRHVDLLSLDVEGYELEVLKGVAFDKTTFDWILVEVRDSNEAEIDSLLEQHGYLWDRIWRSRSYANKVYRRRIPSGTT